MSFNHGNSQIKDLIRSIESKFMENLLEDHLLLEEESDRGGDGVDGIYVWNGF